MPSPWKCLSVLPLVLLLALLALPLAGQSQNQPPETFSEEFFVRETELIIDLPDLLENDSLQPGDFQVLLDGAPREITRVEPVSDAETPWTVVVYVDEVLAGPGTVFFSALSLAEKAAAFTALGDVEVVIAGSDPTVALPATREARRIQEVLTELAGRARVERDRRAAASPTGSDPTATPDALTVQRQLAKLLAFLSERRPSGPHALLLVADGFAVTPEQVRYLESGRAGEKAPGGAVTAFRETARLLSAYGWVTVPVPMRQVEIGSQHSTRGDVERFRTGSAPPSKHHAGGPPPTIPFKGAEPTPLVFEGVIDLAVRPEAAPLRTLARATAGTVIGFPQQVDRTARNLSRRWRIWYAAPDSVDGAVRPVSVRFPKRRLDVRAQEWVRSSTPEGIAEARVSNMLSGLPPGGTLPLTVQANPSGTGLELRIEAKPYTVARPAPPGPVRISWAFLKEDGSYDVRHETVPSANVSREGFRHTLRVTPPPGARRLAVAVEDLAHEAWGGTLLPVG